VASPVCSQNAAVAFNFLASKGLSSVQAAGVIGNLQVESYLNPKNDVPDPTKDNPLARGKGIASWGPPRWQSLVTFAAGRDPWALDTQLDFLWAELQSSPGYGLAQLLSTTTPEDATIVFQNRFENPNPAKAHTDRRITAANDALECLSVRPPLVEPRGGVVIATVGVLALVTAVGYGIYKAFGAREPEPEPIYPPPVFRPSYRPTW
jgi:hypothetical protein